MTPLYVDASVPTRVCLEGPSLAVRSDDHAQSRYPLRRLTRVVVRGAVEFDTPALVACLRRGIPVTFLDARGEAFGFCHGHRTRELPLDERLRELLARPDWREVYQGWFAAAERRELVWTLRRLRLPSDDMRPSTVQRLVQQALAELACDHVVQGLRARLRGCLAALCAEVAGTVVAPSLAPLLADDLDLIGDLVRVIGWRLEWTIARLLRSDRQHDDRRVLHAFEQDAPALREALLRALWLLDMTLRERLP